MQSKREYLVSKGLAKPGRGKFSNDAKAELELAESKGIKFLDTGIPTKNPAAAKPGPKTAKSSGSTEDSAPRGSGGQINSPYLFPSDFRYPEAEYVAVEQNKTKRILHSMREACNTCRVSLTNHACDAPTIHGNIAVKIERR